MSRTLHYWNLPMYRRHIFIGNEHMLFAIVVAVIGFFGFLSFALARPAPSRWRKKTAVNRHRRANSMTP